MESDKLKVTSLKLQAKRDRSIGTSEECQFKCKKLRDTYEKLKVVKSYYSWVECQEWLVMTH